MKKILYIATVLVAILALPSCEGPEGPQGPPGLDGVDGEDGEDGIEVLNLVFEGTVTFSEENDFAIGSQLELSPGDNLLVYLEWAQVEENSLWRLLPQTVFFGEGATLTYNYQYTNTFFNVFMQANFDLNELEADWKDNQRIRVVLLPGFFVEENARVDFSNFDAVMDLIGKDENDILPLDLK
ncbi:hypothetical protein [Cyclobacterium jeungdonense]|uniref:Collagen-like protein n=1 Tax=Cyclobacterium jeungdonense TaxID=708087 RepID=A0ABT8C2U4_9BACT|nr:hypothetical protein [Cyclobacterium jeungdonense]MDN3686631.1 hypothetical protein [Cyclobacterium jeungdonense]